MTPGEQLPLPAGDPASQALPGGATLAAGAAVPPADQTQAGGPTPGGAGSVATGPATSETAALPLPSSFSPATSPQPSAGGRYVAGASTISRKRTLEEAIHDWAEAHLHVAALPKLEAVHPIAFARKELEKLAQYLRDCGHAR